MSDIDNLCMGCMQDNGGQAICPHCGFDSTQAQPPLCIPLKTILQGRYVTGRKLDSNGEGIGYLGYDLMAEAPVYIREFLPDNMAAREEQGNQVNIIPGCEVVFREYKTEFLNYFRSVARMRQLSAITPIFDIFEENNTAYTVSDYAESITLREFVQRSGGMVPWNTARPLFMPVLSSLSALHAGGVQHLGISPDTLVILRSGRMRLQGFSIRQVRLADTDLTPEFYNGCSALEQYIMDYPTQESTDVYGFTASLFFALTGTLPQSALKRRVDGRLMIPTTILKEIPAHVVTALANGLQVLPDKRTPTFERLREELSAAPSVTMVHQEVNAPPRNPAEEKKRAQQQKKQGLPGYAWTILACVVCLVVFTLIALLWQLNANSGQNASDLQDESSVSGLVSSESASTLSDVSSLADDRIEVPNLTDVNYEEIAQKAAQEGNYEVLVSSEEFSDTIEEGNIISQVPAFGSAPIQKGSSIAVVVSKGSKMRTLPYVDGLTLVAAAEQITNAGLVPVQEEQYSDTVAAGSVIGYRDYQSGQTLEAGSSVTILVSRGKEPGANTN